MEARSGEVSTEYSTLVGSGAFEEVSRLPEGRSTGPGTVGDGRLPRIHVMSTEEPTLVGSKRRHLPEEKHTDRFLHPSRRYLDSLRSLDMTCGGGGRPFPKNSGRFDQSRDPRSGGVEKPFRKRRE
jgi:hypothetical protein